jgi:hypothetical protein
MSASTEMLKGIFRSLIAIIIAAAMYLCTYAVLDVRWWIDVNDIQVIHGEEVIVARDLNRYFSGAYIVTIRHSDGSAVCSTGEQRVQYDPANKLPSPMSLADWAFGGKCTAVLASPLKDGAYTMETCHRVLHPLSIFPSIQRCVATAFYVGEPEQKRMK